VSLYYGDFNILANKTMDTGCNFNQSFTGQINLSGNNDGSAATFRMIERLIRTYNGAMRADGTFSGTGSGNLDGFGYTGQINGQVTNNNVVGGEIMTFNSGCPGAQVYYAFSGTRTIQ
jgi:hypothetical protein